MTPDPGKLIVEIIRPMVREEIRAALRDLLAEREKPPTVYVDTAGAAEVLGTHTKTVERLARAGTLKSYRAGRCLRFRREDLDAYMAGGR